MQSFYDDVKRLRINYKKIFIYGAGAYGQDLLRILKKTGEDDYISGFIVTKKTAEIDAIYGLPVFDAKSVLNGEIGIILGVNRINEQSIRRFLKKNHISDSQIVAGRTLLGDDRNLEIISAPEMEITTKIGCPVNCRYCPQTVLIDQYKKKNREMYMSLETFRTCLDKLPSNCIVRFCGFVEPFVNPETYNMLELACSSGRKVELFSTLVGLNEKMAERVANLPIDWVCVHLADKKRFANIPITEEYLKAFKVFVEKKKGNKPFVDAFSAQTDPDPIYNGFVSCTEIPLRIALTDRAGNIDYEDLISGSIPHGKLWCSKMGKLLNSNVLLPDGTVVLCCMDYGMKHILGNLRVDSYDAVMNGNEIKRVSCGMGGDESVSILCRKCSYASFDFEDNAQ